MMPNSKKSSVVSMVGVVALVIVSFSIGLFAGRELLPEGTSLIGNKTKSIYNLVGDLQGKDRDMKELNFNLFWDVWDRMTSDYVEEGKVDQQQMLHGAIKGLVSAYDDPATVFLNPEETKNFNDTSSGSYFSGIGAELGYRDGQIVVISPIKGSPAIAAGVRSGDVIYAVDNEPINPDETIYEVVMKIRGEEGSKVVITLLHPGERETVDIEIVRGQITVPSMDFALYEGDKRIAVLDVARFTDSDVQTWKNNWDQMIKQVEESGAKGLVIDLRGNPGGFITSAVHAAGEFLPKDAVVSKMENRQGDNSSYKVERKGKLTDFPIVVLVNEGSASASEILSGALQKNNRAKVVGVTTYGKGTAQDVIEFSDGSSLHITVMKWLLPDGQWINPDNPIEPDFVVELTDENFKAGTDPQMDKAIQLLQESI